jgi:septal ring factor EnvC (AmiA/AmiB activator)
MENEKEIQTHKEAKAYFDSIGMKKLPTIKHLQEEYAELAIEKNALYASQKDSRQHMVDMVSALQNVEKLLNYRDSELEKNANREER